MPCRFATAYISVRSFQTPSVFAPQPALPLRSFLDAVAMFTSKWFQMSYILLVSVISVPALHGPQRRVKLGGFASWGSRGSACPSAFPSFPRLPPRSTPTQVFPPPHLTLTQPTGFL